jgi:hypothetical protein
LDGTEESNPHGISDLAHVGEDEDATVGASDGHDRPGRDCLMQRW